MMKQIGKMIILLTLVLALNLFCTVPAFAAQSVKLNYGAKQSEIQPYADVIEIKYRINSSTGELQYRRWNATYNYWVDPYWITL